MSQKHGLTALAIEKAKPGETRREVSDGRGLFLVIQPSGAKSWAFRYRHESKPRKLTFDGKLTLATARKLAADARDKVEQGIDPGAEKQESKAAAKQAAADTLQAIAERYLAIEIKRNRLRSIGQRKATLERLVFPEIGRRPIAELRKSEIARLLDRIEQKRGPRMADVARATLTVIFNWHAEREDAFRSPLVRVKARSEKPPRARILSDDELRAVWGACETARAPFGNLVRFILLTATRRNEAARMVRAEISGTDWEIPAERFKNHPKDRRPHLIPLSATALEIVTGMPVIVGSDYVFTSTGKKPVSDFGAHKRELDRASGVTGWTLHDLRRTSRSLMSRAGISADHAEIAIGHKLTGIRGTYDRHAYHAEKQRAFEVLATQINLILYPVDNVTALRR